MYSDLMPVMTMMRAKMRIVMTVSLNLKANTSHVCVLLGKRKLAQSGVEQWQQQQLVWSCLGAANASKQPDNNATMAARGAPSGANGLFVGSTVGVTKIPKAMGFVRLMVADSDVSMQVGVTKPSIAMGFVGLMPQSDVSIQVDVTNQSKVRDFAVLTAGARDASMQVGVERVRKARLLIALLTAGARDASMQVGVERVLKAQLLIALPTAGEGDVSMQVGVERVPEYRLCFARLTAGASDASMQVVAISMR
jgi:hypothetical protein